MATVEMMERIREEKEENNSKPVAGPTKAGTPGKSGKLGNLRL